MLAGFGWLRIRSKVGLCAQCHKPSDSTQIGVFLDQLSNY